jgi:hypothetical protein
MSKSKLIIYGIVIASISSAIIYAHEKQAQAGLDSISAVQQIQADSLNPLTLQSHCGLAPAHMRTADGFAIEYPAQNVRVGYLGKPGAYRSVTYWSIRPSLPIALNTAVTLLGCTGRNE